MTVRIRRSRKLEPRDIDTIIFPGTGGFVQRALGLRDIPCLVIRQQCTGFIYGLSIADAYIRTGACKHILLIGSEVHSTGLDMSTAGRDVTVLFGDGAGAVVVGRATDEAHLILSTHIRADGSEAEILWTEYPASARHSRTVPRGQVTPHGPLSRLGRALSRARVGESGFADMCSKIFAMRSRISTCRASGSSPIGSGGPYTQ